MKITMVSGKRKRAVARASFRQGTGKVRINNKHIDIYQPKMYRLKLKEPLIIAGDASNKIDIDVNVYGGGISSQADACRLVIAKSLVQHSKSEKLRETFLKYDRAMLVADVRRKESSKPNRHGKARSKRQKSYR
ncbi:MAG: 30S ribosomal protein S9 [Candidatus Woesearchaeota archaeon]|jgi:small subunit ribosomal protein S9|nr:30S ribosomal protein S9 [Candidatus Woesearchaeota archaeon]MDP7458432.1 30S ribosomal protein S9 [Candidatus Woesearchaeota archaeon]